MLRRPRTITVEAINSGKIPRSGRGYPGLGCKKPFICLSLVPVNTVVNPVTSTARYGACRIELNRMNRLVVRAGNGEGIAYFSSSERSAADSKLAQLKAEGECL